MKQAARVLAVALAAVAAYALWQQVGAPRPTQQKVETLDPAKVILLRTEGGHLVVSEMRRSEEFAWQTGWACPLVDCSKLPKTTTKIQVTASYVYRIPLAAEWRLQPAGDHYKLIVPPVELQLPVGLDTTDLKLATIEESLFSPAAAPNREMLLRQLGPELARRGASTAYLNMQQAPTQKTVREFATKWMLRDGRKIDRPIDVVVTSPPG